MTSCASAAVGMSRRRTISRDVVCGGNGLHTGRPFSVRLSPNFGSPGIRFDLPQGEYGVEDATPSGTSRGTDLIFPCGTHLKTVEHLLAAAGGLDVDSMTIAVRSEDVGSSAGGDVFEIPALDGCAAGWGGMILEAGIAERDGALEFLSPPVPVALSDAGGERFVGAFPSDIFRIDYIIRYPSIPDIGTQAFSIRPDPDSFASGIMPARTFALDSEIEMLYRRGLAKGGSLENATVFGDRTGSVRAKGGLRFPDEPVRHKVLDLIGDLVLVGRPLRARVIAFRAGHEMHLRLVRALRALILRQ
jgi:UDP-3-O-[3-hydroxymyristoyl] N-acetylglucosamine deacetylase